jgi:hypothetical protein
VPTQAEPFYDLAHAHWIVNDFFNIGSWLALWAVVQLFRDGAIYNVTIASDSSIGLGGDLHNPQPAGRSPPVPNVPERPANSPPESPPRRVSAFTAAERPSSEADKL